MVKAKSSQELGAFRQWLKTLSMEELCAALQFEASDLLLEMVDLQTPPRTPIHPRALSYRPASGQGATDGRNEEQCRWNGRFCTPRLFQWQQQNRPSTTSTSSSFPGSLKRKTGRRKAATGHAGLGGKTNATDRHYTIIARKFVTKAGDRLSLGCTDNQRNLDRRLLMCTHFQFVERRVFFRPTSNRVEDILELLRVASRGNLGGTTVSSASMADLNACAPWLRPTERWFSLSMFLANRYEVALWVAFRGALLVFPTPVRDSIQALNNDSLLRVAIERAAAKTVRCVLKIELSNMRKGPKQASLLRDGLMFRLFGQDERLAQSNRFPISRCSFGTDVESVLLIEAKTSSQMLKEQARECLLEELSVQLEQSLMASETDKGNEQSLTEPFGTSPANIKKKRSRNKKARKRRKNGNKGHATNSLTSGATRVGSVEATRQNIDQSDSEDEPSVGVSTDNRAQVRFAETTSNQPPSMEHTRKLVMVLSILDDVIEGVFEAKGLNVAPASPQRTLPMVPPASDSQTVKQRSKTEESKSEHADTKPTPIDYRKPDGSDTAAGKSQEQNVASSLDTFLPEHLAEAQPGYSSGPPLSFSFFSPQHRPVSPFDNDPFGTSSHMGMGWDFSHQSFDRASVSSGRTDSVFAEFFSNNTDASISAAVPEEEQELNGFTEVGDDTIDEKDEIAEAATTTPEVSMDTASTNEKESAVEKESLSGSQSPTRTGASPSRHSPILISLADLKTVPDLASLTDLNRISEPVSPEASSNKALFVGSLPNSPVPTGPPVQPGRIPISLSKEDLRRHETKGGSSARKGSRSSTKETTTTSRAAAGIGGDDMSVCNASMKSLDVNAGRMRRQTSTSKVMLSTSSGSSRNGKRFNLSVPDLDPGGHRKEDDVCAQSETAMDLQDDHHDFWQARRPQMSTYMSDRDGVTPKDDPTWMSGLSQKESEEVAALREERNTFRDMCLTLGAEVGKLKNLLAAKHADLLGLQGFDPTGGPQHIMSSVTMYAPEFMPPFFYGIPKATSTIAAHSDAGLLRGDHESLTGVSEEGLELQHETTMGRPGMRDLRMSSNATLGGSEASLDQSGHVHLGTNSLRDAFGFIAVHHGAQSRLTKDILKFVRSTHDQLGKEYKRRNAAVGRLTRLVTALWPRSQVKLYGSHVTGLALPFSDLDFVVCLPAVHKNAPAVAPGALEGRNAINESSQKLLARKLKSESWIDPRSIKVIERTVIPVIKVATKDTRAKMVHLDISFDGPVHHGLEANQMVKEVIAEMPMVQPLVLVLKQFLLDRGLLTSYTGGLSSYCLFLMVTKYLQEQPTSWGDCGSLLMGFLDFYGNSFDPRATGISVSRREYFSRSFPRQAAWNMGGQQRQQQQQQQQQRLVPKQTSPTTVPKRPDFLRRHSFSEKGFVDGKGQSGNATTGMPVSSTKTPTIGHGGDNNRLTNENGVGVGAHHATQQTEQPQPQPHQKPLNLRSHLRPTAAFHPTGHHRNMRRFDEMAGAIPVVPFENGDRPYTFDPLFVEDPLSVGNNVGRNAFRIFQVQRAFSDAHRTLIASLEWEQHGSTPDMNGQNVDYPLLQCLLHSEDVFFDFEDHQR